MTPSSTMTTAAVSMESAYTFAVANLSDDHPRSSGLPTCVQCFPGYSLCAALLLFVSAGDTCGGTRARKKKNAACDQRGVDRFAPDSGVICPCRKSRDFS